MQFEHIHKYLLMVVQIWKRVSVGAELFGDTEKWDSSEYENRVIFLTDAVLMLEQQAHLN